jgi:hypothetical protein
MTQQISKLFDEISEVVGINAQILNGMDRATGDEKSKEKVARMKRLSMIWRMELLGICTERFFEITKLLEMKETETTD